MTAQSEDSPSGSLTHYKDPYTGMLRPYKVTVEPVVPPVRDYSLTMPAELVRRLYLDIDVALRALGVDMAGKRGSVEIPAMYALYDALYAAGMTG